MDLAMVWNGKTIIFVQNYGFDVRLPVVPSKCFVERDGQVIEGCDSCVGKTERWLR
jgi:hypothetical protein